MANISRTGAINAAAVWCARELVNIEPQQRGKFKNALEAALQQKLHTFSNPEEACVIQVTNGKPNAVLERVLKQLRLTESNLKYENIIVFVYPDVVWVDKDCNNFCSDKMYNECIYKVTCTT